MSYIGNEPIVSATRTITEVTATAGQTVFVANGGYTVGYIDVFLNGAQLQTVDFTATNGSSITLTEATQAGDVIRLVAWGTFSTSNLVSPNYTGTLTGGTDVVNIGSGQIYKDASGNVGIGTSSPAQKLHVNGGGSATYIQLSNTASGSTNNDGFQLVQDGVNCGLINREAGYMSFDTSNTERMRINSSGNLLVGTTTIIPNNLESARFHVLNTGTTGHAASFKTNATSGFAAAAFSRNGNNGAACEFMYNPTTTVGSISVTSSATAYNTSSDYRLKENIAPMTGALNTVSALKPVTYTWKTDGSSGQGFIAHELQEVVPDCVTGEKDAVDAEGNPVYQGIDTSFLVATLTAAIQEQQAIIEDLKQRIETLESK